MGCHGPAVTWHATPPPLGSSRVGSKPPFVYVDARNSMTSHTTKDRSTGNPICEKMYLEFEKRVNSFGYSLKHPEVVTIPKSFQSNVLIPQEADLHTSEFSKFKKSLGIKLQDASD